MKKTFDISKLQWINEPKSYKISAEEISITTEPETDYWQRTYYNFRNDNGHALTMDIKENFTFSVKTEFNSSHLYDQCGVIIYQGSDNWFKASIEYENESISRLGSVVTNLGYSDWATTDIETSIRYMWYRLSRRGQDFLIENSTDGISFKQMRIFHLHEEIETINLGIYACSPLQSSFEAKFSEFSLSDCIWKPYQD